MFPTPFTITSDIERSAAVRRMAEMQQEISALAAAILMFDEIKIEIMQYVRYDRRADNQIFSHGDAKTTEIKV